MSNLPTLSTLQSDAYFDKALEKWKGLKLNEKTFIEELQFATIHVSENFALQKCDAKTIINAVISVASCGLSLNPIKKLAYLIPYSGQCKLMPSYQGLEKLLTDCGSVKSINVQIVWQGDDIEIDLASEEIIKKHVPYVITGKEKGEVKFVYSIATLQDGTKHIEYMDKTEIQYIRDNFSVSYGRDKAKSVWATHEGEMMRKTVVKRHFKHLPKSLNSDFIYKAIELDNEAGGFDSNVTDEQLEYINQLIGTSDFDNNMRDYLVLEELPRIETKAQASKFIAYLQNNQAEKDAFWQREIAEKVKSAVERPNT
jgi:recombination protein RecT